MVADPPDTDPDPPEVVVRVTVWNPPETDPAPAPDPAPEEVIVFMTVSNPGIEPDTFLEKPFRIKPSSPSLQ